MSHDCSIQASLKVAESHSDAAIEAVTILVKKKKLSDQHVRELYFHGDTLCVCIDLYGNGGMRDEDVQSLANQLGAFVTEPGVIEFVDHDALSNSEAARTCYWVAADEDGRRQARVRYALKQMDDWIHDDDFDKGVLSDFKSALLASIKNKRPVETPKPNFLMQSGSVRDLIEAAVTSLPMLFGGAREKLEKAIRAFETVTVPTEWSVDDINDDEGDRSPFALMSMAERRDTLWRFAKHYEITDSDWERLRNCANDVVKQRKPGAHIKVEFADGSVIYAPVDAVERALDESNSDLYSAINIALAIDDPITMIETDRHFDAEGNAIS